jgi:hypothetical protein
VILSQHQRISGAELFRERDEAAALRPRLDSDAPDAGDHHVPGKEPTGSAGEWHPLRDKTKRPVACDHFAFDSVAFPLAASPAHERPRRHQ